MESISPCHRQGLEAARRRLVGLEVVGVIRIPKMEIQNHDPMARYEALRATAIDFPVKARTDWALQPF